jgi:hypothetical protein
MDTMNNHELPAIGEHVTITLTNGDQHIGTVTYKEPTRIGLGLDGGLTVNGVVMQEPTGPAGWTNVEDIAIIRRSRPIGNLHVPKRRRAR